MGNLDEQAAGGRQPAMGDRGRRRGCWRRERSSGLSPVAAQSRIGTAPLRGTGRHVALQLVRSATGGGANYEEARAAESRDDFIHKLGVAAKEIREAGYSLALVGRSGWRAEVGD